MRFCKDGPEIPDELLHARDEGRVVFFCGAGVSQAKAELPDFFGLAEKVMETLGVQAGSPARKLIDEARNIECKTGVAGTIPADRIFGLLEREFSTDVIEEAVASALRTEDNPDLTAHRTILDLATTRENLVHIITTNFDRLFDDCDRGLSSWQRSRLPDPSQPEDMNGIVYLHGKATSDYQRAEGDGFVLSSSQFGQAYLSEGWATSFFREIIDKYVVVFVGYAADDPPVHYLLEGLNRQSNERQIYAFQAGKADDAASKWGHRGVTAIPYAEDRDHTALWDALEAWAQRARDPDTWYSEVIDKAKQGPRSLAPHERGQVAHIVSTVEGVKKFSQGEKPPSAEWLCVFDKYRRYGEPDREEPINSLNEPSVDPFDLFYLDSDERPIADSRDRKPRKPPDNAWDAFALNRVDKTNLRDDNFPSIMGLWEYNTPPLPARLNQIGTWIGKVADQPAAVWWAVRTAPLHPEIRRKIRLALTDQRPISPTVRKAWYYLLEYWEQSRDENCWHGLKRRISTDGWSSSVVRAYGACFRPYLQVEPPWNHPRPPEQGDEICLRGLICLKVVYPSYIDKIEIPDEWVARAVIVLRKNLETALALETEADRHRRISRRIRSIIPDDESERNQDAERLSGYVTYFTSVFERLVQIDPKAAKKEFLKWPTEDDTIFARLRIWAAGKSDLVSDDEFGSILADMSDKAFWDESHGWDLLHTLLIRWEGLSADTRTKIEARLLRGRSHRQQYETEEKFNRFRTLYILARITWLSNNGCELQLNLAEETDRLRQFVPDWEPEHADELIVYGGPKVKSIKTETDHSSLLNIPLASVLSEACEQSRRRDEPFVRYASFAGLSDNRPVRAFAALRIAANERDFPDWAWSTFLDAEKRKSDKPRFVALIAERLACYLDDGATELVRPAASWLMNVSDRLSDQYPASFRRVTKALIQAMARDPENADSEIGQVDGTRDWIATARNAPAGQVACSVLCRAQQADFLDYADKLLALPSDLRRHALTMFSWSADWFYDFNREWSEQNILSALDSCDPKNKEAFWGGFLWENRRVGEELFTRLKPRLLQLAGEPSETCRGYGERLSSIILQEWVGGTEGRFDRRVSNEEFRAVLIEADDEFRCHVLQQMWEWKLLGDKKKLLREFLKDVWPHQRKANSSEKVSGLLCGLVFSNEELFPELVDIIVPRLEKIDRYYLWHKAEDFGKKYPRHMLRLLSKLLPDNVSFWPDNIENIFASIIQGDPTLRTDNTLIKLKRRWDSR